MTWKKYVRRQDHQAREHIEDDISDIVSVNGESVKEVEVSAPKKKRGKKGKTTLEL